MSRKRSATERGVCVEGEEVTSKSYLKKSLKLKPSKKPFRILTSDPRWKPNQILISKSKVPDFNDRNENKPRKNSKKSFVLTFGARKNFRNKSLGDVSDRVKRVRKISRNDRLKNSKPKSFPEFFSNFESNVSKFKILLDEKMKKRISQRQPVKRRIIRFGTESPKKRQNFFGKKKFIQRSIKLSSKMPCCVKNNDGPTMKFHSEKLRQREFAFETQHSALNNKQNKPKALFPRLVTDNECDSESEDSSEDLEGGFFSLKTYCDMMDQKYAQRQSGNEN